MSDPNSAVVKPFAVPDVEAARVLNVSVAYLRRDRQTKQTIPFIRIGDKCLYEIDRVLALLRSREVGGDKKTKKRGRV